MRQPVHDEGLSMEEALAAIRRAITYEEAGETASPTDPRTSGEQAGAIPTSQAGLPSRAAPAASGSAFNTLTETMKMRKLPRIKKYLVGRVHCESDVVTHAGALWQARSDTVHAPPHSDWICTAHAGRDGSDG